MTDWQVERIDREHVRQGFDCGEPSLNQFLESLVGQYEKRDLGRTYVATLAGDRRVLGYYTLAGGSIEADGLPANLAKKLPRHALPVVLLARLAVDRSVQGRGLSAYLLRNGLARAFELSESLGIHAIVVDAIDSAARDFYERFGFLTLVDDPLRLFLPMGTIRSAAKP